MTVIICVTPSWQWWKSLFVGVQVSSGSSAALFIGCWFESSVETLPCVDLLFVSWINEQFHQLHQYTLNTPRTKAWQTVNLNSLVSNCTTNCGANTELGDAEQHDTKQPVSFLFTAPTLSVPALTGIEVAALLLSQMMVQPSLLLSTSTERCSTGHLDYNWTMTGCSFCSSVC